MFIFRPNEQLCRKAAIINPALFYHKLSMILTTHMLVGAAVALKISNPFLALSLALLSHYFLDMIPHDGYSITNIKERRWNKSFFDFSKVFFDVFIGISLISLFSDYNPIIYFAAFLGIVPDGVTLINRIFPGNKLMIRHQKLHTAVNIVGDRQENKKIPFFGAIVGQVAALLAAIFFLR